MLWGGSRSSTKEALFSEKDTVELTGMAKTLAELLLPPLVEQLRTVIQQELEPLRNHEPQISTQMPQVEAMRKGSASDQTSAAASVSPPSSSNKPFRQRVHRLPSVASLEDSFQEEAWTEFTHRHFRSYNLSQIAAIEAVHEEEINEMEEVEKALCEGEGFSDSVNDSWLLGQQLAPRALASYHSLAPHPEMIEHFHSDPGLPTVDGTLTGPERAALYGSRSRPKRLNVVLAAGYRQAALKRCEILWHHAEQIVASSWFQHLLGWVVVLNCLSVGLETDYYARGAVMPTWLDRSSAFFCCFFLLELLIRIFLNPCQFLDCAYWDNFMWNVFDLLVVSCQVVEMVSGSEESMGFVVLRICRIFRILRIVRVVRFFHELRTLLSSCFASLELLFWALVMLLGIVCTVALTFCQLAAEKGIVPEHRAVLSKHFGTMGWSIVTMLECITGGISWCEVFRSVVLGIGPGAGVLFIAYILTCLFAVTNAVTGVVVEKITTTAVEDKSMFLAQQLRDLFFKDGQQKITKEIFNSKAGQKDMKDFFKNIDVDPGESQGVFALLDIDGDGELDPDELVNGCLRLAGPAQALDIALVMRQNNVVLKVLANAMREMRLLRIK